MKNTLVILASLGATVMSLEARAARAWLLPSQTVIANSGGWVAVDAADRKSTRLNSSH